VDRCKVYYKGEGGGFPQVRAMMSLMCPCCPLLVLTPKALQLCTNHLVLVLCRSVWVSEACQLFLIPSRNSNTPLYPSKLLQTKEHAPTPYSSVVLYLGITFESFLRSQECVIEGLKCESKWKKQKSKESKHAPWLEALWRGRGVCWSSRMGLRRIDKLQLLTQTYTKSTQGG